MYMLLSLRYLKNFSNDVEIQYIIYTGVREKLTYWNSKIKSILKFFAHRLSLADSCISIWNL